jgi:formylmethanofuran dehydrogenase subunit E
MATDATVVCIRGPSGSGKTTLAGTLVPLLGAAGLRTGYLKRSHHRLDLPGKDSDRIACAGADAVLVHDAGGSALFRQPDGRLPALLDLLPDGLDVVLVETFRPERYPAILTDGAEPQAGETLLLRAGSAPFGPDLVGEAAERIVELHRARALMETDAEQAHAHHHCAGAVLGRRLARHGAALLGIEIPRHDHRLFILSENDGCAADALGAATGCRPGNRTLRFEYDGKLSATFVDAESGRAVRVAARGDCREAAARLYPDVDRRLAQLLAYERLPDEELFTHRSVSAPPLPEARRDHPRCAACGEEVDGDAAVIRGNAEYCRPCARVATGNGRVMEGAYE